MGTGTQRQIAPSILECCSHELKTVDMNEDGTNTKSLCDLTGSEIWTNCRSWGTCTLGGAAIDTGASCLDSDEQAL